MRLDRASMKPVDQQADKYLLFLARMKSHLRSNNSRLTTVDWAGKKFEQVAKTY